MFMVTINWVVGSNVCMTRLEGMTFRIARNHLVVATFNKARRVRLNLSTKWHRAMKYKEDINGSSECWFDMC